MPTKLTSEILAAAIDGFELQKKRIDDKIAEIRSMLGGGRIEPVATPNAPVGKRKFSAAARRKMALAQKARWAKIKGDSEPPSSPAKEVPKAKRKISAEGIKNIIAAQKKRWRVKAAAKSAPAKKAVVKKTAKKAAPVTKAAAKRTAPAPALA